MASPSPQTTSPTFRIDRGICSSISREWQFVHYYKVELLSICVSLERLPARSGNRAPGIPDLTLDPPVFPFAGFRADRAQAGAPDVRASVVPASRTALSLAVEYFW